jgi:P4 family phage/plasmid primase-like protien
MNREQCYYTWEGVGGKGKSKIVELMRLTFGDYQTSLQATTLTRKRPESGAANPDIIAIKNRRFIYLQEPDDKEPLNTSRMKQFSGEDMVEARGLYKDQEKFKVSGKLNMMCNSKPIIRTMDRGTWRRIRVVEFISKFCDNPDHKKPYEFVADRGLQSKLSGWSEIFMYMLIQYYQNSYVKNGIQEPPEVLKNTASYRSDSDIYSQFVEEFLREDANSCLSIDDIFPIFRGFLQQNNINQSKHTRLELEKRLNKIIGKANSRKKWKGWKVAPNDDDDDEVNDDN